VSALRAVVEQVLYGVEVVMEGVVVRGQLEVQPEVLDGQPEDAGDEVADHDACRPREQDDQEDP
jgi:hypothetical protein